MAEFWRTDGYVVLGISDFIQSLMIRQLGTAKTMLVRNIFTFAVASLLGAYLIMSHQLRFDTSAVLIITCSSAAYVSGYYFYMRGCEVGNLSLVSPIASTYSLVTILFSIIFYKKGWPRQPGLPYLLFLLVLS
ncbi:EamA family transporter [Pseudomonas sp. NA13]